MFENRDHNGHILFVRIRILILDQKSDLTKMLRDHDPKFLGSERSDKKVDFADPIYIFVLIYSKTVYTFFFI